MMQNLLKVLAVHMLRSFFFQSVAHAEVILETLTYKQMHVTQKLFGLY